MLKPTQAGELDVGGQGVGSGGDEVEGGTPTARRTRQEVAQIALVCFPSLRI